MSCNREQYTNCRCLLWGIVVVLSLRSYNAVAYNIMIFSAGFSQIHSLRYEILNHSTMRIEYTSNKIYLPKELLYFLYNFIKNLLPTLLAEMLQQISDSSIQQFYLFDSLGYRYFSVILKLNHLQYGFFYSQDMSRYGFKNSHSPRRF